MKQYKNVLSMFIILLLMIIFLTGCSNIEIKDEYSNLNAFNNETTKNDLIKILGDLNMDAKEIINVEKKGNWISGPKYSCLYITTECYIDTYETGKVACIRKGIAGDIIYDNKNLDDGIEKKVEVNGIVLKGNELGDYGKYDKFDGKDYIRYYVPEGKYEVKSLLKGSNIIVETVKIHKNSEGYDEPTTISQNFLINVGDTAEIIIKTGYCISISSHSAVKLVEK